MNIKTFLRCVSLLPAWKSVMIMGDHGIGKSMLVRKIARMIAAKNNWADYKVIDRRLSQMSEGDIIGLPFKEGEGKGTRTRFAPADWFMQACEQAALLFLDEANRATGEVIQAAFQIGLDHELNGNVLHQDSRVFIAINDDSSKYQVSDFDPAFLSRWFVVKLTPTVEEWLEWATSFDPEEGGCIHKHITDYIKLVPTMLDPQANAANMEKGTDRRSWDHFSRVYTEEKLDELNVQSNPDDLNFLQQFASGFLGATAAAGFVAYVKTLERYLTAEQILNEFDKHEARIKGPNGDGVGGMNQSEINLVNNHLVDWFRKNTLSTKQAENFGKWFHAIPAEISTGLWQDIAKYPAETTTNIKLMHRHVSGAILAGTNRSRV